MSSTRKPHSTKLVACASPHPGGQTVKRDRSRSAFTSEDPICALYTRLWGLKVVQEEPDAPPRCIVEARDRDAVKGDKEPPTFVPVPFLILDGLTEEQVAELCTLHNDLINIIEEGK